MRTESGQNNLLITWRPSFGGAELTQVKTPDVDIMLPDTIDGLPVTALGRRAFAPDTQEAEGEQIKFVCGINTEEPDNSRLKRITLPPTLRRVEDYAFYNCVQLQKLELSEPIDHWGTGVFMNCRMLEAFVINAANEHAQSAYYFAGEFTRELDITVNYPRGESARLIFPGYSESYSENISARCLDYMINGFGFPYHNMFKSRALVIKDYDRLWPGLMAREHDRECALRIAWYRLRYPRALTEEARRQYLDYLSRYADEVIHWRMRERDTRGLAWFLPLANIGRQALAQACEQARVLNAAEALALLLDEQHRRFEKNAEDLFEL